LSIAFLALIIIIARFRFSQHLFATIISIIALISNSNSNKSESSSNTASLISFPAQRQNKTQKFTILFFLF
jgi:hypothetical protein